MGEELSSAADKLEAVLFSLFSRRFLATKQRLRRLVSFNATTSRVFVWLEIVFALSFLGEVHCMLKIFYLLNMIG